ncbi:MAG: monoheme cytochrome C [Bacteroidota bacterium]
MRNTDILEKLIQITRLIIGIMGVIGLIIIVTIYALYLDDPASPEVTELEQSIPIEAPSSQKSVLDLTGLEDDPNIEIVAANCTACHSAKLVTQNRATREGWKSMIVWMQQTQNLWDLGKNEDIILDYLAKYYAPEKKGRRAPLTEIEWYRLNE